MARHSNSKSLSRPNYFMKMAELTALRGTCNRLQVGCVLVNAENNRIAAVGYNSSHKGTPHCNTHKQPSACHFDDKDSV